MSSSPRWMVLLHRLSLLRVLPDNAAMVRRRTSRMRYLKLHRGLAELRYRHDPVGLAAAGAPRDEYYPEVGTIIPRLKDALGPADVRHIVHQEFVR